MKFLNLFSICSLLFLSSCGVQDYTDGKYPPTNPANVEVVTLGQLQKPYEIIGQYRGNPVLQSMRDWKKYAARTGADAVSLPDRQPDGYVIIYFLKWKPKA